MERRPKRQPIIERNVAEAQNLVVRAGHVALNIFIERGGEQVSVVTTGPDGPEEPKS